jgi:amino acid transporter
LDGPRARPCWPHVHAPPNPAQAVKPNPQRHNPFPPRPNPPPRPPPQRVVVILGRARLLPAWLGRINGRTHTPVIAGAVVGVLSMVGPSVRARPCLCRQATPYSCRALPRLALLPCPASRPHSTPTQPRPTSPPPKHPFPRPTPQIVALLVPLQVLADTVSLGTLWAFSIVCLGIAWRPRFRPGGYPPSALAWRGAAPGAVICLSALAAGVIYSHVPQETQPRIWFVYLILGALWVAATATFHASPVVWRAEKFRVPLNPWLPCFGAGCSLFLAGRWAAPGAGWQRR